MWVWLYMLLGIFIVRFMIPDEIGKRRKDLLFLSLSYIIIVFFVGSRSPHLSGSSDLYNYFRCYGDALSQPVSVLAETYSMERGYLVFNRILGWIVPWNYFITYFEVAFCTAVMFWYIYRNAESVFLAVMIYICFGPWQFFLTGFRQSFAISICFIAFEIIKKNKFITDVISVGLIALAASLHVTAWVFLVVFILRVVNVTKRVVIYSSVLTFFLFFTFEKFLTFGNDLLGREYTDEYRGNVFAGLIPIIAFVGTFILCYLIWTWDKTHLEQNRFEIIMLIIGMCIYIIRYKLLVMERISFYFTPVISVTLANAITRQRTKKVSNVVYAITVALCVALYVYRTFSQYGEYYFYWEYIERMSSYS